MSKLELKCPIHKTDMFINLEKTQAACQDINCVYGHGIVNEIENDTVYPCYPIACDNDIRHHERCYFKYKI